jgi:hypothetical protein
MTSLPWPSIFVRELETLDKGEPCSMTSSFVLPLLRHKGKVSRSSARGFNLEDSFDITQQFSMVGSPLQPNRVWVYNDRRVSMLRILLVLKRQAKACASHQSLHMDFNEDGKCRVWILHGGPKSG